MAGRWRCTKHQKYHWHLSTDEQEYFKIDNIETTKINRKLADHDGFPSIDLTLENGKVKYDAENKTRICAICNKENRKYNRRHILNHVIPTRGENKQNKPRRIGKGKLVEIEDYIIRKMEHDYGRIRTEYESPEEIKDFVKNTYAQTVNGKKMK